MHVFLFLWIVIEANFGRCSGCWMPLKKGKEEYLQLKNFFKKGKEQSSLKRTRIPCSYEDRGWTHLKQCQVEFCAECTFWKHHVRWKKRCRLNPTAPDLGSWVTSVLHVVVDEDGNKTVVFGVGCMACMQHAEGLQTTFAKGTVGCSSLLDNVYEDEADPDDGNVIEPERKLMCRSLIRHQSCDYHIEACKKAGINVKCDLVNAAPSEEQFRNVLTSTRSGEGNSKKGIKQVGSRKNAKKMRWCLAESHRGIDRKHLRRTKVLSLMQDVRHAKLLIRFKATDQQLRTRKGVLGIKSVSDASAKHLKEATLQVMARASTQFVGAPARPKKAPAEKLQTKQLERMLESFEQFTSDAAPDEQLAGELLREKPDDPSTLQRSATNVLKAFAPNLKIVDKDKSHGVTRILFRPWRAHHHLNRCFTTYIWGKQSITATIHNSLIFRKWLEDEVKILTKGNARVRNLSLAKQRFGTSLKSGRRFVLFNKGVNRVAGRISATRISKKEGKIASEYVASVNEEDLLTVAALMEASTETHKVLRPMDDEDFDSAEQPFLLDNYLRTVNALFGPSNPVCWAVGLTRYMLQMLTEGMVVSDGKVTRLLGGAGAELDVIKERVRGFMNEWVIMARLVVRAEFPSFHITFHFRVFALSTKAGRSLSEDEVAESLGALALFFALCKENVMRSFAAIVGLAMAVFSANPTWHNVSCWVFVFVRRPKGFAKLHKAFKYILMRYACWTGISSGVEQTFSLVQWAISARRSVMADSSSDDVIKLIADQDQVDDDQLIKGARRIWRTMKYGKPRKSPTELRADSGRRRTPSSLPSSVADMNEAQFIRSRDEELKDALGDRLSTSTFTADAEDAHDEEMLQSAEMQVVKESLFQHKKRHRRLVQAILDGSVAPETCSEALLQSVVDELKARKKRRVEKLAEAKRFERWANAGKERFSITSDQLSFRLAGPTTVTDMGSLDVALAVLLKSDADDYGMADLHVTPTLKLPTLDKLAVGLSGGMVVPPIFVKTDGQEGWCIAFKKATSVKRAVFVTPGFKAVFKGKAFTMLQHAASLPGSKWKVSADLNLYKTRRATALRNQKMVEVRDLIKNFKVVKKC